VIESYCRTATVVVPRPRSLAASIYLISMQRPTHIDANTVGDEFLADGAYGDLENQLGRQADRHGGESVADIHRASPVLV
jgi:hypothetical protein